MTRRTVLRAALFLLALVPSAIFLIQLSGPRWWSISLSEDPGISWMIDTETPQYRVLRIYAEPGATRRMHQHADAAWHTFTLAMGKLTVTVEGQPPVDVTAGQTLALKGGVQHTFTNKGNVPAAVVEVFGKAQP